MSTPSPERDPPPRRRLPREERQRQLMHVAWRLVREEGTDALTLGRLAEEAGITKPVVYDHFGTRNGLLIALYQDYDARQAALMDAAIQASAPGLDATAGVIACSYVACVLTQGREMPGVLAALAGSAELEKIKRAYQMAFIAKCRGLLAPFTGPRGIAPAAFWAMLGAADALSDAAVKGDVTAEEAEGELFRTILALVGRSHGIAAS
ncbi:TetR/AcrR family transcriptional regulator [Starkeya sp. 3C]|nr:TetR/AcrR family transcriptional regulator [Ancylobacter moscoviensis]TSJ60979.1 TetR/AcrR family transcriptional regulator [Ancylobacter moscoviensis]